MAESWQDKIRKMKEQSDESWQDKLGRVDDRFQKRVVELHTLIHGLFEAIVKEYRTSASAQYPNIWGGASATAGTIRLNLDAVYGLEFVFDKRGLEEKVVIKRSGRDLEVMKRVQLPDKSYPLTITREEIEQIVLRFLEDYFSRPR
ncbi:MAG: hypothetical protein HYU64_12460 [Armatimonadetes bacterium]|nr:hypothetical protein [Armatimonadota bacterium]